MVIMIFLTVIRCVDIVTEYRSGVKRAAPESQMEWKSSHAVSGKKSYIFALITGVCTSILYQYLNYTFLPIFPSLILFSEFFPQLCSKHVKIVILFFLFQQVAGGGQNWSLHRMEVFPLLFLVREKTAACTNI
jgi:hypothetical protein